MPNNGVQGDVSNEGKAELPGTVELSEDTLGLCLVIYRGSGHVSTEVVDNSRDVRAVAVRAVQKFSDEIWKRE